MRHLQELYMHYKDKGLVVLGFDCADDKQIALETLRDNGVTFPNIIDSSDTALKVCFQEYQGKWGSAVPMSYVIDREGKVVNAWYGYEPGHPKVKAFLEKAGITEAATTP
jgi:peroxiredoxin